MRFVRWFVYLWFSLTFGMFIAGALSLVLRLAWSTSVRLPGDGGPLWLVCAGFIAMSLVFGQWEHFGERIRIVRWALLCVTATFLGVAGFALGLAGSF